MIGKNTILGAGNRLFLRPKPPGSTHSIEIQKREQSVCILQPWFHLDSLHANTDYLFEVEVQSHAVPYL